jgi:hypothetical protein
MRLKEALGVSLIILSLTLGMGGCGMMTNHRTAPCECVK